MIFFVSTCAKLPRKLARFNSQKRFYANNIWQKVDHRLLMTYGDASMRKTGSVCHVWNSWQKKKYNQIKVLFLSRTRFFCQIRKIWTSSEFSLYIIKADELTVPNSTQEISRYLRNNFSEVSLFLLRASFRLRLFFPIQILTVCPLCDVHIFICTKFTEGHSTSLGYLWHN